ncbi:MAG: type II toxin-antitoxin system HicB family antitoxin [Phycisphaerae bacterium]|jgi:predicted RNase H-like HicB family nuclease
MKLSVRIVARSKGGYAAVCPSLPGCMGSGRSREEAQKKLDEAIRGYFAAVNNFVPENLACEVIEV